MMLQVVMVQFSVLTLVTVAMAAACAVLLLINLYVGIPSLLRNFGG